MANVRVYRSNDLGAPVLTNIAGALVGVFDACLVNGLPAQALTSASCVGSVVTATLAGHNLRAGDTVTIAGANEAAYNGTFTVATVPTSSTFTYTATAPATATGTPTFKKTGAGWTKAFSATNKAAYRQGGGNMHYLNVDDTAITTALVRGYESMTAQDTGSNAFPTVAQMANFYWCKSDNAGAKAWVVIATDKTVYFYVDCGDNFSTRHIYQFGNIKSYKTGDSYATFIWGSPQASSSYSYAYGVNSDNNVSTAGTGRYIARSYNGAGGSMNVGVHSDYAKMRGGQYFGYDAASYGLMYPHGPDAGLYVAPLYVHEPTTPPAVRGEMAGIWNLLHQASVVNHGDTFVGTGPMAGKTFEVFHMGNTASTRACLCIETSDTWGSF